MLTKLPLRLQKKISPEPMSGCWIWTACADSKTLYGRAFNHETKTVENAHRVIYELLFGYQDGLDIDHLCRNRICVNPDHLEPVTRKINVRRGEAGKGSRRRAKSVTHCPHGHEYTSENTISIVKFHKNRTSTYIHRRCKTCNRKQALEYYYRNK